ncbi:MAG: antibiotic biosynthesis monooxygenase family protein [Acidimicrobiales bacterium]|jgi:heme-degrading monooxygenase HmoA
MIVCLIEFETRPGMEEQQQYWLNALLPVVETVPGFISKESYAHVSGDGRISTVSLWETEQALLAWTKDRTHQKAMKEGKEKIFSRYSVRICSEIRQYEHSAVAD